MSNKITAALGTAALLSFTALPFASAANAKPFYNAQQKAQTSSVTLGGVDLDAYCKRRGYEGVELQGRTAYDWKCVKDGNSYGINMHNACRSEYGAAVRNQRGYIRPGFSDVNNPYGWTCSLIS